MGEQVGFEQAMDVVKNRPPSAVVHHVYRVAQVGIPCAAPLSSVPLRFLKNLPRTNREQTVTVAP